MMLRGRYQRKFHEADAAFQQEVGYGVRQLIRTAYPSSDYTTKSAYSSKCREKLRSLAYSLAHTQHAPSKWGDVGVLGLMGSWGSQWDVGPARYEAMGTGSLVFHIKCLKYLYTTVSYFENNR